MIILFKFAIINDNSDKIIINSIMSDKTEILPGAENIFIVKDIIDKTAVKITIDKITENNYQLNILQVEPVQVLETSKNKESSNIIADFNFQILLNSSMETNLYITAKTNKLSIDKKVLSKNNSLIITTTQEEMLRIQITGNQILIN